MFKRLIPQRLKTRYWTHLADRELMAEFHTTSVKYARELDFWRDYTAKHGTEPDNDHYQRLMLAMLGQTDPACVAGKIVADFGCGPKGSLCWATTAKARLGIDVLADGYMRFGVRRHDMIYVCSSETAIPLPSNYVDITITMNAMDHTEHFAVMCRELIRITAKGGLIVASFNLDEPPTSTEPQTLSPEMVDADLLSPLRVLDRRVMRQGPTGDRYRHLMTDAPPPSEGRRIMWVRAEKP